MCFDLIEFNSGQQGLNHQKEKQSMGMKSLKQKDILTQREYYNLKFRFFLHVPEYHFMHCDLF